MIALLAVLAASVSPGDLATELRAIERASGGTLGVFVEHLERGQTIGLHAERAFPMASTFKLPLAVVALHAVDEGRLPSLATPIELRPADLVSWASPLHEKYSMGGRPTLREVLTALLEESDNSAADALLRLCGGAARVRRDLGALGIGGLSIDRDEAELSADFCGVPRLPTATRTAAALTGATAAATPAQRQAGLRRFQRDLRDRTTPRAMAALLARLWRDQLLTPASRAFLRAGLTQCHTGGGRLRAGVPAGTPVADRTGTCGGLRDGEAVCANDVGVVTLPDGTHVVIAAYLEQGGGSVAAKEATLAAVSRAVWRHFSAR